MDTTFKDISECANVGYGTIYIYFNNKEDLLQTIVDDIMDKIGKELYINYSPSDSSEAREVVYNQIYNMFEIAMANQDLFRIISDALSHSKVLRSHWEAIFNNFTKRTIEDLRYSQKYGLAKKMQKRVIAKCIVYMVREFIWEFVWKREDNLEMVTNNIVALYFFGAYKTDNLLEE